MSICSPIKLTTLSARRPRTVTAAAAPASAAAATTTAKSPVRRRLVGAASVASLSIEPYIAAHLVTQAHRSEASLRLNRLVARPRSVDTCDQVSNATNTTDAAKDQKQSLGLRNPFTTYPSTSPTEKSIRSPQTRVKLHDSVDASRAAPAPAATARRPARRAPRPSPRTAHMRNDADSAK